MREFEYADAKISDKELMIAIPSITVGVGILNLPKKIAETTVGSDGWVGILIAGIIFTGLAWAITKLCSMYPHQLFVEFAGSLVTKPVAIIITILLSLKGILISGFVLRTISEIAKEYLFDRTPIEVIALTFILVVIYAISGSRVGLFRLNMMFFPIIVFIIFLVGIFSINWFDTINYLPVFKTDLKGYVLATKSSAFAFTGLFMLLFYTTLVRTPKKAPKSASIGMSMVPVFYIIIYLMCIGVFGFTGTSNLNYPIIELAKEIEIPGGFFERFDSIFFVIWIMAIFNTVTMAFDASIYALESVFKVKKKLLIYILAPIVFLIGMLPQDVLSLQKFGDFVSMYGVFITGSVTIVLLLISYFKKRRKAKQR
ncbi:germination protein GerLB [Virgibacillus pantothenticus]|uniref:Spore gernimation protein n=1 Tax=Virgibacillus pantothenticus TaxID=1473 RepID=A0A0L0QL74_VIRPA|nr:MULTISPECIES: endospore germination permease [Virgibacillus]API91567.1 spore gernimation protein [Virgibacillus sp. 6R]KNE19316.1 spore gernimation protein [Virgibacillus pantothenticus]MBS7426913.1 endospore germination permease [Virgibacillus sp. 19R1-5]MBU8567647.1 spore germination protein [Virgibacillus pantothenticus]MBU8602324.1 spore germination protein [Virgibacillus pantothenticus]